MDLSPAEAELRERFFRSLLQAAFALKTGPDPEVTLEALIEAASLLKEHLEHELEELRLEQAE
jgi:hypothetical protein